MAGKASFNWIDPLLLDQQLTEEERMEPRPRERGGQTRFPHRVVLISHSETLNSAIYTFHE